MAASRKKAPDLVALITSHWPDALSGQCALELGLSGGLDSVVLLHLLAQLRQSRPIQLSAVHVHHGLSPNADAWAHFCQALCDSLGVPLRIERVRVVRAGGESLEACARAARYEAYARTVADALVLAQHRDDLAETVLLQALRGGGPHALAAMPAWAVRDGFALWRPLLGATRVELQDYARQHELSWVEDESNSDTAYRRNWLRHAWLPLLAARQPDYRSSLARCASRMADAARVLDEVAAADLAGLQRNGRLPLEALSQLSPPRQRLLLLSWVELRGLGSPAPAALEEFQRQLWQGASDRMPLWHLPGGVVFRYRGELWAEPARPESREQSVAFEPDRSLPLTEWGGVLSWRQDTRGIARAWLEQPLRLLPRRAGECLLLPVGNKPVKNLLQEAGVPPYWRGRWPLICAADGRVLALAGLAVALDARDPAGEGWWPQWQPEGWALNPQNLDVK